MSKALAKVGFDYESVDKDTKSKLIALSGQINRATKTSIAAVLDIGQAAFEAHDLLAGDGREGKFNAWIESETGFSKTTIYEFKDVYARSKKLPVIGSFPPTVACLMAAPSVSDAAIKDFEKQIDKGTKPTIKAAKATLDRFREVASRPKRTAGGRSSTAPASSGIPAAPGSQSNSASSTTPAASGEPAGGGLDPQDDEPIKDLSFEEQVKQENGKIESFCRGLVKFFEDGCPRLGSVDHMGRYDSALAQVRAACSTLRTCKYQEAPCPKCKGNGCSTCEKESDFGAVSVLTYRQIAG